MNPVNHAATALLIKKKWPDAPLLPTLIAVELIDVLWITFNLLGLEKTNLDAHVNSLKDIHFDFIPYSHSVFTTLLLCGLVYLYCHFQLKKPQWGLALALGISSHVMLDILTHTPDIPLLPWLSSPQFGTGLYGEPVFAFVFEIIYCIACWSWFGGSKKLLIGLMLLNLSCVSFYIPALMGPENFLKSSQLLFPVLIGIQAIAAIGFLFKSNLGQARKT